MKNERKIKSVVISAMVLFALLAVFTASASASGGTTEEQGSPDTSASLANAFYSTTINGDYVAAGVGMRGNGSGTITIAGIPSGSTIVKAVLYWAIVDTPPENATFKNGVFNGTGITGTLIGTDGDPCWDPNTTYAYRANVTSWVTGNGSYALTGFATGPSTPQTGYGEATTPPLCEGASLVVVYSNPASACRDIVIYDGADTINETVSSVSTGMTGFTASAAPSAKTTYIVADGQDQFSDDTLFNSVIIANDSVLLGNTTSFEGSDGKLWDTDTYDVSAYVSAGATSCTVKLQRGTDCLVHIAQVFSVTGTIEVAKDYRFTDVCFEKDNDLDGSFNEDPAYGIDDDGDGLIDEDPVDGIDNDGDGLTDEDPAYGIDDDLDGLIDEDPIDCPDGTNLSTLLPIDDDGNYTVEAVVHKNNKVRSYNPGQYYAVSTVNVLDDVEKLEITENWSGCMDISALNPKKGGGCVVIVEIREDVAYQILDAKSPELSVDATEGTATATLGAVSAGTTILMYVKFGPAHKHADFAAGTCENTNTASVVTSEGDSASEGASATLELIRKVYGD